MKKVAERVKKVVVERLGVDASRVTDTTNFSADLCLSAPLCSGSVLIGPMIERAFRA
jgi:hypothetical protein